MLGRKARLSVSCFPHAFAILAARELRERSVSFALPARSFFSAVASETAGAAAAGGAAAGSSGVSSVVPSAVSGSRSVSVSFSAAAAAKTGRHSEHSMDVPVSSVNSLISARGLTLLHPSHSATGTLTAGMLPDVS